MKALAITAILIFILAHVIHLFGYIALVQEGEVSFPGLFIYEKVTIAEIAFTTLAIAPILRNRKYIAPILLILFVLIPGYHLTSKIIFWNINGYSYYDGIDTFGLMESFVRHFVLFFGLPYTLLWFSSRKNS